MACDNPDYGFFLTDSYKDVLIAKVSEFNNEDIHKPGYSANLDLPYSLNVSNTRKEFHPSNNFQLEIYANGLNCDTEGYISVLIECTAFKYYCRHSIIGVIDSNGNKRFLRSFTFPSEFSEHNCCIERYIKRETILSETDELLPGGCLTLYIYVDTEIMLLEHSWIEYKEEEALRHDYNAKQSFTMIDCRDEKKYFLCMDSRVAESLRNESSYFQRILEIPMKETHTRLMNIPAEEYPIFKKACCILMGSNCLSVSSINDIFELYMLADKYDLPVIIQNCRSMLFNFLRNEKDLSKCLPAFIKLAETYNDAHLKKMSEFLYSHSFEDNSNHSKEKLEIYFETEFQMDPIKIVHYNQDHLFLFSNEFKETGSRTFDYYL